MTRKKLSTNKRIKRSCSKVILIIIAEDDQKGKVDMSPLELVTDGLKAIDAGETSRKAFYEANKQYGPQ